jgi:hypothetical protein
MLVVGSRTAGKDIIMNAWSDYLRGQAALADRISKTMTSAEMVKEFADYAVSFRQDADAEDAKATCRH